MKLPFLKQSKWPRMAKDSPNEKLINGSPEDHLEFFCSQELMDAVSSKDVKKFRDALEAIVLNMFDYGNEANES